MKKPPFGNANVFGYLLIRTGRAMIKKLRGEFYAHHPEMPIEHWSLLVQLWKEDGRSQQDLANEVFKDKATVTRALAMLEKMNVVVRVPDEKDKRHKKIYLTHKGKELEKELSPLVMMSNKEALAGISEEELKICKEVLEKVYHNLTH